MLKQALRDGMPDLRSSGLAFLCGLILYGLSRS